MIIYGAAASPFVRKVLILAAEKGVAVDHQPGDFMNPSAEFLSASPFRKMPALRDGDFTLSDSTAIAVYMDAVHADAAMIPAEAKARAKAIWFDEFADTILTPACGKMFFNRFVAPKMLGVPGDEAAANKAEHEELPPILAYLESVIPASGLLIEDRFTLADAAVCSPFINASYVGYSVNAEAYPKVTAYLAGLYARPAVGGVLAAERKAFGR